MIWKPRKLRAAVHTHKPRAKTPKRRPLALAVSGALALGLAQTAQASFPATFQLSALDGTNGFKLYGEAANDVSGKSVSAAGDVNSDGVDDLIVGADLADPNGNNQSGRSYVVFGIRPLISEWSLRMRDCRDQARPGGTIEYGIQVTNAGPSDVQNVLVVDDLPSDMTLFDSEPLCTDDNGTPDPNINNNEDTLDTLREDSLVTQDGFEFCGVILPQVGGQVILGNRLPIARQESCELLPFY